MKRLALCLLMYALPVSAESLPSEPAPPNANPPAAPVVAPLAAKAEESPPPATAEQQKAQSLVQNKLVTPLSAKESERSRFSRVLRPAPVMRVRMTAPEPQKDAAGAAYMSFAVDTCYGFRRTADCWQKAAITGCVYPGSGQIFVQRGTDYFPAEIMLGKRAGQAATVCAPPTLAQAN